MLVEIPEYYQKKIIDFLGPKGKEWLEQLPNVLHDIEKKWNVEILHPFPSLTYNFAALAKKENGTHLVIKAWVPNDKDFSTELDALQIFDGEGISKLLDVDRDNRIFLLEYIYPGMQLVTVEDEEKATHIAASIMKKIWKEVPMRHNFPTVFTWWENAYNKHKELFGEKSPIPQLLFKKSCTMFEERKKDTSKYMLLHGDLHHFNILSSGNNAWIAIDPQGVIGDPIYETGAFLRNPQPNLIQKSDARDILKKRIEIFEEELGFKKEEIRDWAVAQAVLSSMWDLENKQFEKGSYFITCAELLDAISW
jgi:streptomycin 6-kinase